MLLRESSHVSCEQGQAAKLCSSLLTVEAAGWERQAGDLSLGGYGSWSLKRVRSHWMVVILCFRNLHTTQVHPPPHLLVRKTSDSVVFFLFL